jgi:hypothetical protein
MRIISFIAAAALLAAVTAPVYAGPASSELGMNSTPIVRVQEKQPDTITQKVKRTWRKLTSPSYTFCARCLLPPSATVCTARAKSREAARSDCSSRHQLCAITDDMRGCGNPS